MMTDIFAHLGGWVARTVTETPLPLDSGGDDVRKLGHLLSDRLNYMPTVWPQIPSVDQRGALTTTGVKGSPPAGFVGA